MKLVTGSLTLAAMLMCMPVSQADFVIDDFQGAGETTLTAINGVSPGNIVTQSAIAVDGGLRTTVIGAASGVTQLTYGSAFAALATGVGNTVKISYTLSSPFDLHSSGAFAGSPLLLDLFSVVNGTWDLVATYHSTTTGESADFDTVTISSAGPIGLTGTELGRGALASTVDSIDLLFTVNTLGAGSSASFSITGGSIAAVPEPTSIALLGLTGLGGVVVARRRKKSEKAA